MHSSCLRHFRLTCAAPSWVTWLARSRQIARCDSGESARRRWRYFFFLFKVLKTTWSWNRLHIALTLELLPWSQDIVHELLDLLPVYFVGQGFSGWRKYFSSSFKAHSLQQRLTAYWNMLAQYFCSRWGCWICTVNVVATFILHSYTEMMSVPFLRTATHECSEYNVLVAMWLLMYYHICTILSVH